MQKSDLSREQRLAAALRDNLRKRKVSSAGASNDEAPQEKPKRG
jgi:hypothetical protein